MQSFIKVSLAVAIAFPLSSIAQPDQPITRPQVRDELVQLKGAGYNPNDWLNYPESIQRAEVVVEKRNSDAAAYGGATGSTSEAGK